MMGGWYIYFLMYTGVYSIVFILIHVIAAANSNRRWNMWDSVVIVWGVLYAFSAMFFSYPGTWIAEYFWFSNQYSDVLGLITLIGIPSVITMLLMFQAWKSWVVVKWLFLSSILATAISLAVPQVGMVFLGPVVWNVCYGIGCWYTCSKYAKVPNVNMCYHCGYSLVGLSSELPCPECGRSYKDAVEMIKDLIG